jgi:hypothetical protein
MQISQGTLILGAVVLAAGSYALGRGTAPAETVRIVESQPSQPSQPNEPGADMEGTDPAANDPHAGQGGTPALDPDSEPAAITWTVPAAWHTVPNRSSMRIATYLVPRAPGDSADADVSVTRAGGDTASNVDRWAGQFTGAPEPKQQTRKVGGLAVTVVEIAGTYTNGMDPNAKPLAGWALLAAIVETPGMPYFFKMTGPAATVRAARPAFTAMIDGIQPTAKGSSL